jgi:hypothetical protein
LALLCGRCCSGGAVEQSRHGLMRHRILSTIALQFLSMSIMLSTVPGIVPASDQTVLTLKSVVRIADQSGDAAVALAVRDLRRDLQHVLAAATPPSDPDEAQIFVCIDPELDEAEAYRIDIGERAIIRGSDRLGAIHGIYRFSQQFLGVDPLWFWKDLPPAPQTCIALERQCITSSPPAFRYRGWFINDEDLLTEWKPPSGQRNIDYPFYDKVIDLDIADRIFEAILRSRGNLIIPASFVDVMNPAEARLIERAVARGFYVTQHHIEPLGVSHFGFENYWRARGETVRFSYSQEPQRVRQTWEAFARRWRELAGDQVIWQLGLRGRGDRAIWVHDKGITPDDAVEYVSRALDEQWAIVRAVDPRPRPPATMTLWDEGSQLMLRGLRVPAGVGIIFSDAGRTQLMQPDFEQIRREPDRDYGVYYHLAYWNRGPHLVQGVSVDQIDATLRRVVAKGDTHYGIVNVTNIREHTVGIGAVMEVLTQGDAFAPADYLDRTLPDPLHDFYRGLFACYMPLPGGGLFQDADCNQAILKILREHQNRAEAEPDLSDYFPEGAADRLAFIERSEQAVEKLDALISSWPGAKLEPRERRAWEVQLLLQARMLRRQHAALAAMLRSIDDKVHLHDAEFELRQMLRERSDIGETDHWEHWYRGDRKCNWPGVVTALQALRARVDTP